MQSFTVFLLVAFAISSNHGFGFPFIGEFKMPSFGGFPLPQYNVPDTEMNTNMDMNVNEEMNPQQDMIGMMAEPIEQEFNMPEFRMPAFKFPRMKDQKNVTSTNTTTNKDGYTINMFNQSGPGFVSFVEEIVSDGRDKLKNGTNTTSENTKTKGGAFGKLLKGWGGLVPRAEFHNKKCNKCSKNKYCEPMFGKCRERLSSGSACAMMNQCAGKLLCIWAKCQEGTKGEAGTLCDKKNKCNDDMDCLWGKRTNKYHGVCKPRLGEGSICEEIGFIELLSNINQVPTKSRCMKGLKCANAGTNPRFKICVKKSFQEEPEHPSTAAAEENEEKDEKKESSDKKVDDKKTDDKKADDKKSDDKKTDTEKADDKKDDDKNDDDKEKENSGDDEDKQEEKDESEKENKTSVSEKEDKEEVKPEEKDDDEDDHEEEEQSIPIQTLPNPMKKKKKKKSIKSKKQKNNKSK